MNSNSPLAERLRPKTLDQVLGQEHLTGKNGPIRKMLENDTLNSLLFWGPPGTGKTTLAEIISETSGRKFYKLSAVSSGVKDVREIIEEAKKQNLFSGKSPILFIDEIHRFNKSQQDSLLHAVEKGWIVLMGATTENPSFEVVSALLSRSQVYVLKSLDYEKLEQLIAISLNKYNEEEHTDFNIKDKEALIQYSGGDARKLINAVENVLNQFKNSDKKEIDNEDVLSVLQETMALYDKNGEQHYDIISAFIKSMRGSDPNGAVYWLARMLVGGEDIKFIARRMVILASEDIGLANPNALVMANNCFQAINVIGNPEARIILSQTAVYLAVSPKSNSTYLAIDDAIAKVKQSGNLPVPLHLRNAPTKLMKDLNYGKDYD
ncbi:MAG: replication-associated recombination protein A, partial [Flavobacteriales bacterium]|nr:replication-associated recombination protein A [Flavobacteriales bacterium]